MLLVNVDDSTLGRLMTDGAAMKALMAIEGFRNLNADLETIINRSEQIKDAQRKAGEGEEPAPGEKKELTEAEKERKSLRKQVQEKLIKFAARVPVFMYLTDFREQRLKDVIYSRRSFVMAAIANRHLPPEMSGFVPSSLKLLPF